MRRTILSSVSCLALPYFFPHYLASGKIFGEKVSKCIVIFSATSVWNISHSKENSARYHKCTQIFMQSTRYSCHILIKLEFSRQIFGKYSNIKFHENPSSMSRNVHCGWTHTDRQTERRTNMMDLRVAFHNFANAPNKAWIHYSQICISGMKTYFV